MPYGNVIVWGFFWLAVIVAFFASVYLGIEYSIYIKKPKEPKIPYYFRWQSEFIGYLYSLKLIRRKDRPVLNILDWIAFRAYPVFIVLVAYIVICFGLGYIVEPAKSRTALYRHTSDFMAQQYFTFEEASRYTDKTYQAYERRLKEDVASAVAAHVKEFTEFKQFYCAKIQNRGKDVCK